MGTRTIERWAVIFKDGRMEIIDVVAGLSSEQALAFAGIRADLVLAVARSE